MNAKYGKLVDGEIVYAPSVLETEEGVKSNPSEASYLAAGWKKVVEEPPEPEERMAVEVSGWNESETTLVRTYKQVPAPEPQPQPEPQPEPRPVGRRLFSKLKLVIALKAAGLWVLTKTWIEESGLNDHYLAAQELAEDNEFFIRGKAEIMRLSGKTEAEIEAILAECVLDD